MVKKAYWQQFPHFICVLQALFVTFLWSTSWVFIKIGLAEIPPLTFAGLRYSFAFVCLLPIFLHSQGFASLRGLPRRTWGSLLSLGLLFYTLTQGAQFVGLAYLPATTVNLILGFTPVIVALLGLRLLAERPSNLQWVGVFASLLGVLVYFYPVQLPAGQTTGFIAALIGVFANAGSAVLGRFMNRDKGLAPLTITIVSMGVGALLLLITGLFTQGLPTLDWKSWGIIGWLSLVNTAFAFTLWNHTLRTLTAMESTIVNSAMGVQIPILAVLFLGERLTWYELLGLIITIVGVLLVQFGRRPLSSKALK